jgi:hypothetical protein
MNKMLDGKKEIYKIKHTMDLITLKLVGSTKEAMPCE